MFLALPAFRKSLTRLDRRHHPNGRKLGEIYPIQRQSLLPRCSMNPKRRAFEIPAPTYPVVDR